MMFSKRLAEVFETYAANDALQFEGAWWTWAQIGAGARALQAAVESAGLATDLGAAIVIRSRPATISALLGLSASGRCAALISPIQPAAGMANDVVRLRPAVVVADRADWTPELDAAAKAVGAAAVEMRADGQTLSAVLRAAPDATVPDRLQGEGIILPTSGTTGPPKRIPLPWSRLDAFAPKAGEAPPPTKIPRVIIIAAPLVTITGLRPFLTWAARPLRLAMVERLDVLAWSLLVKEHRPKLAGLPPAAMRMMLDANVPPENLASLEGWATGSAPLDAALAEAFEDRFGVPVLSAYGATEFGGAIAGWTPEDHRAFSKAKRGSTGRLFAGVKAKVLDPDTGAEVAAGEVGALEVMAPSSLVSGPGGWVRTNDLVRIDEDGFLFILGRADDVIIRGGFKIPLFELEKSIEDHPAVAQAACVDLPDERLGQAPAAAVVLATDARATSDEIIAWLRERIAPYKIPVVLQIVDELPRNASLKIARPVLRALLTDAYAARQPATTSPA